MKIQFFEIGNFHKIIEKIISKLCSEVVIRFEEDGMRIHTFDTANVAMIKYFIPKESFKIYEVEKENIKVNLSVLNNVLKRVTKQGDVVIDVSSSQLVIKSKSTFNVPLLELEELDVKEFDLVYKNKLTVDSSDLINAMEDVGVVSKDGGLKINLSGEDLTIVGKGDCSLTSESVIQVFNKEGEDAVGYYSIEYLKKMFSISDAESTEIEFSKELPIRITYKFTDSTLQLILAPREHLED